MIMTAARKKSLARDGFLVLPELVPRPLIDAALRDINHRLGTGEHPGKDSYADSRDYLSEYVTSPPVMDLLRRSPLAGLSEQLLGAGRVEPVSQAQVALRFPSPSDESPAARSVHVDGLYDDDSDIPVVRYSFCAGVFLSDVTGPNQGNFTAYPGTHRMIAQRFRRDGLGALKGGVERILRLPKPRQLEGRAGDVVLFHFQTAHDKARNDSPEIRYMAYFRFYHVDAWRDKSREYMAKALANPWLEWPAMRGVHGT
jgi:hypothetical protein